MGNYLAAEFLSNLRMSRKWTRIAGGQSRHRDYPDAIPIALRTKPIYFAQNEKLIYFLPDSLVQRMSIHYSLDANNLLHSHTRALRDACSLLFPRPRQVGLLPSDVIWDINIRTKALSNELQPREFANSLCGWWLYAFNDTRVSHKSRSSSSRAAPFNFAIRVTFQFVTRSRRLTI